MFCHRPVGWNAGIHTACRVSGNLRGLNESSGESGWRQRRYKEQLVWLSVDSREGW